MRGKIISIVIVTLFFATALSIAVSAINVSNNAETLDQYNESSNGFQWIESGITSWQQFRPMGTHHTRVEIWIGCFYDGSPPLTLSIKETLAGLPLCSKALPASAFPLDAHGWVNFDIPDTDITPANTYYLCLDFTGSGEYEWVGDDRDPYPRGISSVGAMWDFCFRTYIDDTPAPGENLDCGGSLQWSNIQPGTTVSGSFTVANIGDAGSQLDWQVSSYPTWGTWTFTPQLGLDLEPAHGLVTVQVQVQVPDVENGNFLGDVRCVNINDASDYDTVPVTITTPRTRQYINSPFIHFLKNHPALFPLLQQLLKL
jgi:hypothetical protein